MTTNSGTTSPILSTKLFIPPPRQVRVTRPRLLKRLNEGLTPGRHLILISAPAGFGKTTLLSEWIWRIIVDPVDQETDFPEVKPRFAWITLDDSDNDPNHFLRYLIGAFQVIDPGLGKVASSYIQMALAPTVLPESKNPIEKPITALLNDLAHWQHPLCLVLDDYHLISKPVIHQSLSFFIEHLPAHCYLVIAGRSEPPIPFHRLRARDQMIEIRDIDLRFTVDEAQDFLKQVMQLNLSQQDISLLAERTEGWPVGLQLVALALKTSPLSANARSTLTKNNLSNIISQIAGSNRYILDYLAAEVLNHQTEQIQSFLLQTSLFDKFNADLCAAALRDPGSHQSESSFYQQMIDYLDRSNLFLIPLDARRQWFRYHTLFAEFLRSSLAARQTTQPVAENFSDQQLHSRASQWFSQQQMFPEAIQQALQAGDFAQAADYIEKISRTAIIVPGEGSVLLGWLDALPAGLLQSRPQLGIYRAWAMLVTGHMAAADLLLDELDLPFSVENQELLPAQAKIIGEAAAIKTLICALRSEYPQAIHMAHLALSHLPDNAWLLRGLVAMNLGLAYDMAGNAPAALQAYQEASAISQREHLTVIALMAATQQGDLYLQLGQLRQAAEIYRQAMPLANNPNDELAIAGMFFACEAQLLYEWDQLDAAVQTLERALQRSQLWESADIQVQSATIFIQVFLALGDFEKARLWVERLDQEMGREMTSPQTVCVAKAHRAQYHLRLGDDQKAYNWLSEECQSVDEQLPLYFRELLAATQARIFLAQHLPQKAVEVIHPILQTAEQSGRNRAVIELHIIKSLALEQLNQSQEALAAIQQALILAEPENFVRIFVDEGEPLAQLLAKVEPSTYRGNLLSRFKKTSLLTPIMTARQSPKNASGEISPTAYPALIEPLSERELDVLRLIAEGHSNQEIAAHLIVAISTVKTHINNIYGKLGVQTRTQALKQARDLHII